MLTINIPEHEMFDEANDKFLVAPAAVLRLEHSLVSLTQWESKWEKPFLSHTAHSYEETRDYISAMSVTGEISLDLIDRLTQDQFDEINKYIEAKMTATWFKELPGSSRRNSETITNEIIRYWMIALNIPLEYETRHLSQLFTLVRVVNEKNKPAKKQSRSTTIEQHRALNEARRAQYANKG